MTKNLLFGVGVRDTEKPVNWLVNGKRKTCPYYLKWRGVLNRCYSETFLKNKPSYIGCTASEEWLKFSNFKRWMDQQDWRGKDLDKDIIKPGNKIYSPEFCCFVPQDLNKLLTDRKTERGKWPVGVHWNKGIQKFEARCNANGKRRCLGSYDTPEKASGAYRSFKASLILDKAREQSDIRIASGLIAHAQILINKRSGALQ